MFGFVSFVVVWVFLCYIDPIMFYILVLFFFFFKQKTAYDMRISDWSSDVCSSDLERCCNVFGTHAEELLGFGWLDFLDRADVEAAEIGLAQVIEELREVRLALRLHRPDGSVRHVELCAAPVAGHRTEKRVVRDGGVSTGNTWVSRDN